MHRLLTIAGLSLFASLGSCASNTPHTRYAAEIGWWRQLGGAPRQDVAFSVPAPGVYDIVLWYGITDSGAGYEALARVAGTVTITFHGHVAQRSTLPRHGTPSELFTDTNGLILIRLKAESAGKYVLRFNITSVPPHLEIYGAGVRVLRLADRP